MNDASAPRIETRKLFVSVRMYDSNRFRGYIHLSKHERLQDVLNDERKFIPILMNADTGALALLAKQYIVSIEEVDDSQATGFSFNS